MDARNKVAVAEAGAFDPLMRLVCDASGDLQYGAEVAQRELDRATRRQIRILQDENKSLKRQLDRIDPHAANHLQSHSPGHARHSHKLNPKGGESAPHATNHTLSHRLGTLTTLPQTQTEARRERSRHQIN